MKDEKQAVGRPRELINPRLLTVYLDGESMDALDELSKQWNISNSAVIRKLLRGEKKW